MTHYVCTGNCGAVSETAGACQAASCSRFGQAFSACDCTDGQHAEVFQKSGSQAGGNI